MKNLCALAIAVAAFLPVWAGSGSDPKIHVQTNVVYGQVHGAGLLADIAYPEGKGPFPAIVSVHGGRWVG